jgi:hypothetical protein
MRKIRLGRAYGHWRRQRCIFIHVPKVAGTSINRALYGRPLGHFTASEIRTTFPGLSKRCLMFAVVRNPWARTLSAFKFARAGRTDLMGMARPEQYRTPEFETFGRFLRDWLAPRDLSALDFVFRPQMEFISDQDGSFLVDSWGRLENLEGALAIVEKHVGRRIVVPHVNSTSRPAAGDSSYRDHYTDQWMVDLVREKYWRDIKYLDYEY